MTTTTETGSGHNTVGGGVAEGGRSINGVRVWDMGADYVLYMGAQRLSFAYDHISIVAVFSLMVSDRCVLT